jgi:hypothetical protein
MGNITNWLIISIIISILLGIVSIIFVPNPNFSAMIIVFSILIMMGYGILKRCPRCGNLGALFVINTKLINSHQDQRRFTRTESVGVSVRRNRHGEVIDETTQYADVDYVTTITTNNYEDTIKCKNCGDISTQQYQKRSEETHRY